MFKNRWQKIFVLKCGSKVQNSVFLPFTICLSIWWHWQVHSVKQLILIPFWNLLIFPGKGELFEISTFLIRLWRWKNQKNLTHLGFCLFNIFDQNILNAYFSIRIGQHLIYFIGILQVNTWAWNSAKRLSETGVSRRQIHGAKRCHSL